MKARSPKRTKEEKRIRREEVSTRFGVSLIRIPRPTIYMSNGMEIPRTGPGILALLQHYEGGEIRGFVWHQSDIEWLLMMLSDYDHDGLLINQQVSWNLTPSASKKKAILLRVNYTEGGKLTFSKIINGYPTKFTIESIEGHSRIDDTRLEYDHDAIDSDPRYRAERTHEAVNEIIRQVQGIPLLRNMEHGASKLASHVLIATQGRKGGLGLSAPEEVQRYAERCLIGPYMVTTSIGYFPETSTVDRINAYPHELSRLPLFSEKHVDYVPIHTVDWHDALQVFVRVNVDIPHIPERYPTPIGKKVNGQSVYLPGRFDTYLTKDGLEFMERNQWGEFEILDGWAVMQRPGEKLIHPYEPVVSNILQHISQARQEQAEYARIVLKAVSVTITGKTLQKNPVYILHEDGTWTRKHEQGRHYFPLIGVSVIEANKMAVFQQCLDMDATQEYITGATDSITFAGHFTGDGVTYKREGTGPSWVINATLAMKSGKMTKLMRDYMQAARAGDTHVTLAIPRTVGLGESRLSGHPETFGQPRVDIVTIPLKPSHGLSLDGISNPTIDDLAKRSFRGEPMTLSAFTTYQDFFGAIQQGIALGKEEYDDNAILAF